MASAAAPGRLGLRCVVVLVAATMLRRRARHCMATVLPPCRGATSTTAVLKDGREVRREKCRGKKTRREDKEDKDESHET
uniref:Secreted protein n=1 Tax=Oryza barthii TaxID=65489 RepID=A0A0D3EJB1_9ORYZ